ncbi:DNA ligase/mRNA capping enzyme [Cantharellus anzutake]|uniref:DNA ligase/mRNA capping enzyme n=1 Tax=Cantharellus anzutake TaxID=1750568 RepID=UPI0019071FBA|nr:DNA ligase/mRNA capping enzyme [Cantharellus anzutake]KAF8322424.1 DNA ligase/mRNA capping enzyme [Cantharellus anzutake]
MSDSLADIQGKKPKVLLADGEEREVSSQTSSSKYKVKRTGDHYYCTCPAWRMQIDARSCKHLKSLLGEEYENARVEWKNPGASKSKGTAKKGGKAATSKAAKASTSKKRKNDQEDASGEGDQPSRKRSKGPNERESEAIGEEDANDEDDEDDEDDSAKKKPDLLLAVKWDLDGQDPAGWWASEKLDGVRAYYDGKRLISRLGNPFAAPQWFLDELPKNITLDGELFAGRRNFQDVVSIVRAANSPSWKEVKYHIFDVPSAGNEPFEQRMSILSKTFLDGSDTSEEGARFTGKSKVDHVIVEQQTIVRDRDHVLEMLKEVESRGGEGLMLREPGSLYVGTRSNTLLKVKTFYDAEARVIGYTKGKGKHAGKTGALLCEMASGKKFSVGSGLSDKQRANPPSIGSIIVYRFQELTRDGVPRFPTFAGESADKTEPKDVVVKA